MALVYAGYDDDYGNPIMIEDDSVLYDSNTSSGITRSINPDAGGNSEVLPDVAYQGDTNEENNISKNPYVSPADASRIPQEFGEGITSSLNKLLGTNMTGKQLAGMFGAVGGGILGASGLLDNKVTKVGYQGGIPKYDAVRNMMTAPPAGRRPGSGGINYGGDVQFVPKGSAPSQGTGSGISELLGSGIAGGVPSLVNRSGLDGLPAYKESGGSGDKTVGNDDPFFQSPEYKAFQKGQEGMMSTMDMYYSPYFGPVGSGSSGRAMDEAYRKYKGISSSGGLTMPDNVAPVMAALTPSASELNQMYELQPYAQGGLTSLARGRYLQGDTDGMADKIPAQIGEDQPAALSHGEFVVPADVVSHLGNGNSDAGAKKLYQMMDKIRQARTGTKKQGKEINPDKFMPGGLAKAYANGGQVRHFLAGGETGTAVPSNITGTEQAPASWAGEYITDMLGKGQALSNMPYQAYGGPLTAGSSALQNQAFNAAGNLSVPSVVGDAANTAAGIATKAQDMTFTPGTFTNQYSAPTPYQVTDFKSNNFDSNQAKQYMDPYLQMSLDPQIAAARRQAAIKQQETNAGLAKAGAYGGGRQAVMNAANNFNLNTTLADITGKGYNTAYKSAMDQFNADQARNMLAQQETEKSRQFGSTQGMTAAELKAKYGQDAARETESSRQFGATQGINQLKTALDAARTQSDIGISGADLNLRNIKSQADLGATQRGIEAEGIAADKAQFEEARKHPYDMVTFQQSLLNGLPITAQNYAMADPNWLTKAAAGATTAQDLIDILSGKTPAKKAP